MFIPKMLSMLMDHQPPVGVHKCSKCGRVEKRDLFDRALNGAPQCCGQEMPVDFDASVEANKMEKQK